MRKAPDSRLRESTPAITQPSMNDVVWPSTRNEEGLTACGSWFLCGMCTTRASALRNPQNLLLPDIFAGHFRAGSFPAPGNCESTLFAIFVRKSVRRIDSLH